jgi:hypothetical protein
MSSDVYADRSLSLFLFYALLVTEDYVVVESFSEDDTPPAPAPRIEKAAAVGKGKTEGGSVGGAKKKAGSGNQTLLNFFQKK